MILELLCAVVQIISSTLDTCALADLAVEYGSQDMQNYKESNYEESESDILFHISAGRTKLLLINYK